MISHWQILLVVLHVLPTLGFMIPQSSSVRYPESRLFVESDNSAQNTGNMSRRQLIRNSAAAFGIAQLELATPYASVAEVTDETNAFAVSGSAYVVPQTSLAPSPTSEVKSSSNQQTTATDEVTIKIPISKLQSASLGIELSDVEFRTNRRVFVKSVLPSSLGAQYDIQPSFVVVNINGQSAERTNAKGVAQMISQVKQSNASDLILTFRNDSFQKQLKDLSNSEGKEVTTQVAPAGDNTQRNEDGSVKLGYSESSQEDQKITVSQLIPPKMCRRGADIDDLLEISYVGTVLESGTVFDGSAVKVNGQGVPGRGNDVSIFFVLGKQPFGQFPPSFDVGLR